MTCPQPVLPGAADGLRMTPTDILATVRALRAATTPDAAVTILSDAIDRGLDVTLAAATFREWAAEAARTTIVLDGPA